MQSYRDERGTGGGGTMNAMVGSGSAFGVGGGAVGSSSGGDDLGKYRTRYEESMNPFEVFRGRVSCLFLYKTDLVLLTIVTGSTTSRPSP